MNSFNFWVLVRPGASSGEWVAHCLDVDIISEGATIWKAVESVREAVAIVMDDEADNGLDLLRQRAPEEDWNTLFRVSCDGDLFLITSDQSDDETANVALLATQMRIFQKASVHQSPSHVCRVLYRLSPRGYA